MATTGKSPLCMHRKYTDAAEMVGDNDNLKKGKILQ